MDTSIITTIAASLGTLATAVVALYPTLAKAKRTISGLTAGKLAKISILVASEDLKEAKVFKASLAQRYEDVELTSSPLAVSGRDVVIVWHPRDHADQWVQDAKMASPLAFQLVLSHKRLPLQLGERLLLANSEVRLRSDLSIVADLVVSETES